VIVLEGAEAALSPTALVAFTVKLYTVPLVSVVTVIGDDAPVAKIPPGEAVTL